MKQKHTARSWETACAVTLLPDQINRSVKIIMIYFYNEMGVNLS